MTPAEIYAHLKVIAPLITFTASREYDDDDNWDGDGPNPEDEGYTPYVVTITASTIQDGELIEAESYLSSVYMKDDEEIGDLHGYLPQKIQEAADDLMSVLLYGSIARNQAYGVVKFIAEEMRNRYDAQRAEIEGSH